MIRLATPPEFADAGYWYVVLSVIDPVDDGRRPEGIPPGWTAAYAAVDGVDHALVRTPRPIVAPSVSIPSERVIAAAITEGSLAERARPHGRVGGR